MTAPVQSSQQRAETLRQDLLVKAQYFVDCKYVARADARQKSMGLAYVEAEREDLAREIVNFAMSCMPSGDVRAAVIEDRRQIALAVAKRHSEMLDELTKNPASVRIGGWVGGLAIALQIISQAPATDTASSREEACCQPLWDAYLQAVYVINRYRHLHAGRSVRDLDEAEEGLKSRQKKLDAWSGFDTGSVA